MLSLGLVAPLTDSVLADRFRKLLNDFRKIWGIAGKARKNKSHPAEIIVPVVTLFSFVQKYLFKGFAAGAVKG